LNDGTIPSAGRIGGPSAYIQGGVSYDAIVVALVNRNAIGVFRYRPGTLSLNGSMLALLTATAILSLLDGKLNWWLGKDRRKLQILALGFLASLAARAIAVRARYVAFLRSSAHRHDHVVFPKHPARCAKFSARNSEFPCRSALNVPGFRSGKCAYFLEISLLAGKLPHLRGLGK
jgi:hypothetical protein